MAESAYLVNGINAVAMPGTIIPFIGENAPPGWRICDGSPYNATSNPLLNTALGNPGAKNLPNLYAIFLRGSGTATNTAYNAGSVRTYQTDDIKSHTHTITESPHTHTYLRNDTASARFGGGLAQVNLVTTSTPSSQTGITINSTGNTETRPYCYGIIYIIKMDTDLVYDTSLLVYTPYDNTFSGKEYWNYSKYFIGGSGSIMDISSTITFDASGGSYSIDTGSNVGSACLKFNNVRIVNTFQIPFNQNNFTVSLWVKSVNYGALQRLFSISTGDGGYAVLQHYNTNITWDCDGVYFKVQQISTTDIPQGTWGYICMVVDGTNLYYYANNTAYNTKTRTTHSSSTLSSLSYTIGSLGSSTLAIDYIDELRIYNRSLNADEVRELYTYRGTL